MTEQYRVELAFDDLMRGSNPHYRIWVDGVLVSVWSAERAIPDRIAAALNHRDHVDSELKWFDEAKKLAAAVRCSECWDRLVTFMWWLKTHVPDAPGTSSTSQKQEMPEYVASQAPAASQSPESSKPDPSAETALERARRYMNWIHSSGMPRAKEAFMEEAVQAILHHLEASERDIRPASEGHLNRLERQAAVAEQLEAALRARLPKCGVCGERPTVEHTASGWPTDYRCDDHASDLRRPQPLFSEDAADWKLIEEARRKETA